MSQQLRKLREDIVVRCILKHPNAKLPEYAHEEGDNCADLFSCEDKIIPPRDSRVVDTGVVMVFPKGWGAYIKDKSGLAANNKITTDGGVVDTSYRGVIGVILRNNTESEFEVKTGMKIAQIAIRKVYRALFVEDYKYDLETERGEGGFGSTGAF